MSEKFSETLFKKLVKLKKCRRDKLLHEMLVAFRRANFEVLNGNSSDKSGELQLSDDKSGRKTRGRPRNISAGWIAMGACTLLRAVNYLSWWF